MKVESRRPPRVVRLSATTGKLRKKSVPTMERGREVAVKSGEVAGLNASLKDAEDGIARDHPYDVAFGDDGHLVDVFRLHALEDAEGGFVRQSGMDAINGEHRGLDGCVGPLVARDNSHGFESNQADGFAGAENNMAAETGAQHFMDVVFEGDVARYGGDVVGHDVFGAHAGERIANRHLRNTFLRSGKQEPSDEGRPDAAYPVPGHGLTDTK